MFIMYIKDIAYFVNPDRLHHHVVPDCPVHTNHFTAVFCDSFFREGSPKFHKVWKFLANGIHPDSFGAPALESGSKLPCCIVQIFKV